VLASALSVSTDARAALDPGWPTATRCLGTLPPDTAPARQTPADGAGLAGLRRALEAARRILLGESPPGPDVTELQPQPWPNGSATR
jgi:hypothetical protein